MTGRRDGTLLIVNADDFGISEGVNNGIVEAHRRGILTSTTAMANMPAFDHAVQLWRETPELGVGVHLNLTSGTSLLPPSQIPDLVRPDGRFHTLSFMLRQLTLGRLDEGQIEVELRAQVERVISAGIQPTHVDSHHHVHMHPRLQPIVVEVAQRYGIRALRSTFELSPREAVARAGMLLDGGDGSLPQGDARPRPPMAIADGTIHVPRPSDEGGVTKATEEVNLEGRTPVAETPRQRYLKAMLMSSLGALLRWRAQRVGLVVPGHFQGFMLGLAFSSADLLGVLERLPAGSTELMCHPGYPDEALRRQTSYSDGRDSELKALLDPANRSVLQRMGVRLGTFADLDR